MEGNVGRLFYGQRLESSLTGLELVQETTDKVVLVKEKPKTARDCQKSYVDYRRRPLEFEVGDRPFEILERIGLVAYRLRLPEELSSVHDTFMYGVQTGSLSLLGNSEGPDEDLSNPYRCAWIRCVSLLVKSRDEISLRRGYCNNLDLIRLYLTRRSLEDLRMFSLEKNLRKDDLNRDG
ncbi:hypothetical protein Tco_1110710, partial [Tanacetum coccineum]